jgi:hypothetical protein
MRQCNAVADDRRCNPTSSICFHHHCRLYPRPLENGEGHGQTNKSGLDDIEALPSGKGSSDLLAICSKATSVVHLLKSLSWHASTHVGRLGSGEKRLVRQLINMSLPLLGCLGSRIDVFDSLPVDLGDGIGDPAALNFDTRGPVTEQRRPVRPVQMEHVGVSAHSSAEIGVCSLLPFVLEGCSANTAEAHAGHTTGGDVEPCRDANHVKLVHSAIFQLDAGFCESDNWIVLDIDNLDIGPIELFVVVVFQAGTFHTERVRWVKRGQNVSLFRIVDSSPDFLGPEVVHFSVGLGVKEIVLVVTKPIPKAPVLPQLLQKCLPLFWRVFKCIQFGKRVQKAAKALLPELEELGIPILGLLLLFNGERSLAHRHSQIGGALKHLYCAGFGAPVLSDLHARGACSNDSAAFPFDVHAFIGPERGMVDDALERIDPREVIRDVAFGGKPSSNDEILGLSRPPVLSLDVSPVFLFVELGTNNHAVEGAVLFDLQDLVDVVEVFPQLLVVGIIGIPGPVFPRLRDRELVFGDLGIDTSAGVTVPTPRSPQVIPGLVDDGLEAALSQLVEAVDATKAGTNNQDVNLKVVGVGAGCAPAVSVLSEFSFHLACKWLVEISSSA